MMIATGKTLNGLHHVRQFGADFYITEDELKTSIEKGLVYWKSNKLVRSFSEYEKRMKEVS